MLEGNPIMVTGEVGLSHMFSNEAHHRGNRQQKEADHEHKMSSNK